MTIDLLIKNGKVVLEGKVTNTDIAIDEGEIVNIGYRKNLPKADEVIDADDNIVMPGGIDPHSHYETTFMGETTEENWYEGTRAAAFGGTTTTIDFAIEGEHGNTPSSAVENQLRRASQMSAVNFSTHGCITDFSSYEKVKTEIESIFSKGITSLKEHMIYREEDLYIDDWEFLKILQEVGQYGGTVGVHAENADIGERWRSNLIDEGKLDPKYQAESKPNFVEKEAVQRAISISEFADSNLYIAHMTTEEATGLVRDARINGKKVWAETCPQYLTTTKEIYGGELGLYSICSPPFREGSDVDALWKGLADGTISMIGSDHVAFTKEQKEAHSDRFTDVPNGTPQAEVRVPIVFTEGVKKGRLSLPRFVEVVSTNVAKMFGMYPKKGVISPGSDADIVIIDPDKRKTLNHEDLHMGVDWSLYSGMEIEGWPTITILDGKVIVEEGVFKGEKGQGDFVRGEMDKEILHSLDY